MKKLAASIVLAIFAFVSTLSQNPCLPEGIQFTTQAQIDSFQINYPGCTEIEGFVQIIGNDIVNLTGLNVLTSLESSFMITHTPFLDNMIGLENLTTIGGSLYIGGFDAGNTSLTSLIGLNNLTSIGENLYITCNYALITLDGLSSLSYLGGDLEIVGNYSLFSLSGLENLTNVFGNLIIGTFMFDPYGNPSLPNLSGLDNLTSIGGLLEIHANSTMTCLSGLENVGYIGGDFMLHSNSALINISSLANVTSILGSVSIKYNLSLITLAGLNNIESATINNLIIHDNSSLSTCGVQSICNYLAAPNGIINISDNAPGCNSVEEVEEACETIGIAENDLQSFTIHPNPTDNGNITITLDNPSNLHMTCFNTFGQQIHTQELQATESVVNVNTWQPGIYLAVVYEEGKTVGRVKFVVR